MAACLSDSVLPRSCACDSAPHLLRHFPHYLQGVRTGRSVLHHSVSAADGTRKFLLQLSDGRVVETVSRGGGWGCRS